MAPSLRSSGEPATSSSITEPNDGRRISTRLVLSYVLDWVFIAITAALGRIFHSQEPNRHAFRLSDPSISYPYAEKERVSVEVLVVVSLIVPAAVILLFSLVLIPGRTGCKAPNGLAWRRKLWEWNAGWMGLGVAYAATYAATEGLKVLFGKPRPDLLSRCDPDIENARDHSVGAIASLGIVTWTICRNTSEKIVRDGFVSFPSGHSSTSFAGLTYLSLWLCAKFSVAFPSLWKGEQPPDSRQTAFLTHNATPRPIADEPCWDLRPNRPVPLRNQGAAPPTYLCLIILAPIATAAWIASSRYPDNRHYGWDILAGAVLGIIFAYIGFRLYHLPLSSGAGWAWGPRSRDRAFYTGVGMAGYVGEEGTSTAREKTPSAEAGDMVQTRPESFNGSTGSRLASRCPSFTQVP